MGDTLPFVMPSLGADMEHGVLATWLVKPGDVVKRGQVIAVVETHKGAIEVEFFHDAVVTRLVAEEGDEVPVGGLLAELSEGHGAVSAGQAASSGATATAPAAHLASVAATTPAGSPAVAAAVPTTPAQPAAATPAAPAPSAPSASAPVHAPTTARQSAPSAPVAAAPAATAAPTASPAVAPVATPVPVAVPPPAGAPPEPPSTTPTPYRASILSGRPPTPDPWVAASPAARLLAYQRGIDLHGLTGTGRHGTVTRHDVERMPAAPTPGAPAAAKTTRPVDAAHAMRLAIAAAMSKSNREIPHYYLSHDIDMHAPLAHLAERNAARPPAERVLPAALLVWATARTLVKFPELNGFWIDDAFQRGAGIHPGVAISLRGGGLVTPAMHDADTLTPEAVMAAFQDLVLRSRAGRLRSSEMTDPTITITSLGDTGVESVFGVIYPPQVALVGFGRIADRPVAIDGMLAIHPIVTATLAGDHRASDGHVGARFLTALDKTLQEFS